MWSWALVLSTFCLEVKARTGAAGVGKESLGDPGPLMLSWRGEVWCTAGTGPQRPLPTSPAHFSRPSFTHHSAGLSGHRQCGMLTAGLL